MARDLRHRGSRVPYDNYEPGCMWGLLHSLDFHQHLHIKKMLGYRKHRDGKHSDLGTKIPKTKENTPAGDAHLCLDKDASLQMEDKVDAKNRSSGKTRMRNLLPKRRSKEQDQMKTIYPLESRLLRTISIHHLVSNKCVLPDELTFANEALAVETHSHEIDCSSSREQVPLQLQALDEQILQKRCKACGTMNAMDNIAHNQLDKLGNNLLEKQSLAREKLIEVKAGTDTRQLGDVALHQSKEFLSVMELLNANRELLLKILEDPSFLSANYLHNEQASSIAGSSGRKNDELFRLEHKKESETFVSQDGKLQVENLLSNPKTTENGAQVENSTSGGDVGIINSELAVTDGAGSGTSFECLATSHRQLENQNNGNVLNRFKLIKKRINDVIQENRKENYHISMDGILHKIPYGHKLSKSMKKETHSVREAASDIDDRESTRSKFRNSRVASFINKHRHKSIRRSHSLTDSLDKYSRLLESISSKKYKRLPEITKPMQKDGLQASQSQEPFKRVFSLPEFGSYSLSKDVQKEVCNETLFSEVPTAGLAVGNATTHLYDSDEPNPIGTHVHMEENMESDILVEQTLLVNASGMMCEDPEQPVLIDEHDQCEKCSIREDLATEDSGYIALHEQGIRNEIDHCNMPIFVPNSYFEENPLSPAKFTVSEDPEMKLECVNLEVLDSLIGPKSQFGIDASDWVEGSEVEFEQLQMPWWLTDIHSLHVQVDEKDEAEFNYVRNILLKSGFPSQDFPGTWYSPNQSGDPLLFEEAESSPCELDIIGYEHDMSLDRQLLFDLINEVLLEIYNTFAYLPWLQRFDSHIRPMPVGHHVLEEVWANIRWYLSIQLQLDQTIESVVARDYAKNDRWMNLQTDTEEVSFELEDLILDDLLDEVIFESHDLLHILCLPS